METFLKQFDIVPFDLLMIVVCAFAFILLWRALERKVFGPHLALLNRRESLTSGAREHASELRKKMLEVSEHYNREIAAVRYEAVTSKQAVLAAAQQQGIQILQKAEHDAEELLRKARWELKQHIDGLGVQLEQEAKVLSDRIVEKLKNPLTTKQSTSVN